MNAVTLLDSGLVTGPEALASVRSSLTGLDLGEPQRALDIRVAGGADLRLLPDRGLDIAGAWFTGLPLHWSSRVGERRARQEFLASFCGGLLVTCGLDNVGAAAEGVPMHGTFSRLPASNVTWERSVAEQEIVVTVRAVIDDADALDRAVRCERAIVTRTGLATQSAEVSVTDVVSNLGAFPVAAPMLYHVNLGAPLWAPGAEIMADSRAVHPRDEEAARYAGTWRTAPAPVPGGGERVYEHEVVTACATVRGAGLEVTVGWDVTTMPRLHQWVNVAPGSYALGIEPANCSVLGRAVDRAQGRLPMLHPGESRQTSLRLTARRLEGDGTRG